MTKQIANPTLAHDYLSRFRQADAAWPTGRYITAIERDAIADRDNICTTSEARALSQHLMEPERTEFIRLALRHNNLATSLDSHNDMFVERALQQQKANFDAVGLTERQRTAVVIDARTTLVVAGAGTGKTTTIIAKIDYLVRAGLAKPHEILVVAYNKQAQLELSARIEHLEHGQGVRAQTFHAFGYSLVRRHSGSGLEACTDNDTRAFVHRFLQDIRRSARAGSPLRKAVDSFKVDFSTREKTASFVGNILNFLNRFKTRRSSIVALRRSARTQRQHDFVVLFDALVARYDDFLLTERRIDFSDMIVTATDLIESRDFVSPYRYILIDEFQDITQARWRMISALRVQNPDSKLFVVGDDWQSIYAFDDADVSIMTGLEQDEAGVVRVDLDTNFRFSQPLADESSRFIMRNPQQLEKAITSASQETSAPPIFFHRTNSSRTSATQIKAILQETQESSHVLILGRYRKTAPDNMTELKTIARQHGITLTYHTCHAAKGLEADEVILLDVNGGAMGFPCHLADDEFIQLLPTPSEAFTDAEERRLFYVALTRTKGKVHIIADEAKPSVFIDELDPSQSSPKPVRKRSKVAAERLEIPIDRQGRTPHCPSCHKPTFIKRVGAKGAFWGCSDFPKCWGRPKKCPSCKELAFVLDAPHGARYCAECGASG